MMALAKYFTSVEDFAKYAYSGEKFTRKDWPLDEWAVWKINRFVDQDGDVIEGRISADDFDLYCPFDEQWLRDQFGLVDPPKSRRKKDTITYVIGAENH